MNKYKILLDVDDTLINCEGQFNFALINALKNYSVSEVDLVTNYSLRCIFDILTDDINFNDNRLRTRLKVCEILQENGIKVRNVISTYDLYYKSSKSGNMRLGAYWEEILQPIEELFHIEAAISRDSTFVSRFRNAIGDLNQFLQWENNCALYMNFLMKKDRYKAIRLRTYIGSLPLDDRNNILLFDDSETVLAAAEDLNENFDANIKLIKVDMQNDNQSDYESILNECNFDDCIFKNSLLR